MPDRDGAFEAQGRGEAVRAYMCHSRQCVAITALLLFLVVAAVPALVTAGLPAQRLLSDDDRLAAVRQGLAVLLSQQSAAPADSRCQTSGSFGTDHLVANTSLAIMAFLGAGHMPDDTVEGRAVHHGIEWIVNLPTSNGRIVVCDMPVGSYEHGLALLMMAEVYGMVDQRDLEAKLATKIEDGIEIAQAGQTEQGAWRYQLSAGDADLSITVTMLNGLRACHNAGFAVDGQAMENAVSYVLSCRVVGEPGFAYRPGGPVRAGTNAAGLVCLQITGAKASSALDAGIAVMVGDLDRGEMDSWPEYACYYMAQVCFQAGGAVWRDQYPKVVDYLLDHRKSGGHWGIRGELYRTGMAVIALSAPERQLPIYMQTDPVRRGDWR